MKTMIQGSASAMGIPNIDFKGNERATALMKHPTVDPVHGSPYENIPVNQNTRHIIGASNELVRYK